MLTEKPTGFGQGAFSSGEDMLRLGLTGQDLSHDAPILFDYMRRQKMVNPVRPRAEPFHSIGGRLDLTIIRPTGYEQTLLKTWPDEIGEKICPFNDQAAAA
ncbi:MULTISPECIES: hypothetical protein [unclassified Rhizobium]|uniref:hypothetical protein n=1 Tax=unclassified Rhizobium TaxID=2613769 RepID=UPI001AE1455D|nr:MULTISPECIES: hypothetical protein [unclassified Rhizobium]MBP2463410.1 hypothetical protein [Rhizobium sp. PvP014]MBP2530805.1 hypothetical protein [Rhizobium sp. PvP099]